MRILLVEDDAKLAAVLRQGLKEEASAAAGYWLAGRALAPVDEVTRAARSPVRLDLIASEVTESFRPAADEKRVNVSAACPTPVVVSGDEGSGLGLAIAAWIVGAHAGQIAARNQAEGGSVLSVSLPLGRP